MATYVRIADRAAPEIADYLDIRDRDLGSGHEGRFAAEGESVIKVLLGQERYAIHSLLLADNRVDGLRDLIDRRDVTVYVAPAAVMDAIIGFPIHRGMMALGFRGEAPSPAEVLAKAPPLVLGMVGIANHDNMGGLFRNAAAFGVGAALIDGSSCDPLYRKALRVSVGGTLKVPFARTASAFEMVALLGDSGYRLLALSPRGEIELAEIAPSPRDAVLLGAEGPGLPDEIMARCETVRITMAGGFDSLNVATTSGIALHALTRRQAIRK